LTYLGRLTAMIGFAALAVFATGCGETVIDDAKTEAALEQNLEQSVGQKIASVECPSGVEVEAGKTFDCDVSLADGTQETATLKITNDDADVEVTNLRPSK